MHVATLTIEIHIPRCHSLKQKRRRIKPILTALHKNFNVSAAEISRNDHHQFAVLACAVVSKDGVHVQQVLDKIPGWMESRFPDIQVIDEQLTML